VAETGSDCYFSGEIARDIVKPHGSRNAYYHEVIAVN
jgi:hypothetical protein